MLNRKHKDVEQNIVLTQHWVFSTLPDFIEKIRLWFVVCTNRKKYNFFSSAERAYKCNMHLDKYIKAVIKCVHDNKL